MPPIQKLVSLVAGRGAWTSSHSEDPNRPGSQREILPGESRMPVYGFCSCSLPSSRGAVVQVPCVYSSTPALLLTWCQWRRMYQAAPPPHVLCVPHWLSFLVLRSSCQLLHSYHSAWWAVLYHGLLIKDCRGGELQRQALNTCPRFQKQNPRTLPLKTMEKNVFWDGVLSYCLQNDNTSLVENVENSTFI